jgi:hypothetical protein
LHIFRKGKQIKVEGEILKIVLLLTMGDWSSNYTMTK